MRCDTVLLQTVVFQSKSEFNRYFCFVLYFVCYYYYNGLLQIKSPEDKSEEGEGRRRNLKITSQNRV